MRIKIHFIFVILLATTVMPTALIPTSGDATQVLTQTPNTRKAKATRLFKQGINQYQTNQYRAAMQSWVQALTIYQQTKKPLK